MFEKIGKFFTAAIAFLGTILTFFLMFKSAKNDELDKSYQKDKEAFDKEVEESVNTHNEEELQARIKYETALRDLSDEKDEKLKETQDQYDSETNKAYGENRRNPEKLVKKLSEEYDLEDV